MRCARARVSSGERAQVDVDLVDAAVFDAAARGCDGGLEEARVVPVGGEIDRQENRVRRQLGRFHDAHAENTPRARAS
jgi:hypothetical protein